MKKALSIILALLTCVSVCACGDSNEIEQSETELQTTAESTDIITTVEEEPPEAIPTCKLGDSIETDIFKITLTRADLAIKLNATSTGTYEEIQSGTTKLSDDYFTAEEYDPAKDAGKAFVAPKGHTFVAIEFLAENLDRATVVVDNIIGGMFISVEYNGKTYNERTNYGCKSTNGYKWERHPTHGVSLIAGESKYYRCYMDIPTDANDLLKDEFSVTFHMPTSKDTTEKYKYQVTSEDRALAANKGMSIDEAIYSFLKEEGQEYFTKHMEEFALLTGDEIKKAVENKTWSVELRYDAGSSWSGKFRFDSDGRIKETIPYVGTGYYNKRTWKVSNNMLVLKEGTFEVRKLSDNAYLLVKDGAPYMIMKK